MSKLSKLGEALAGYIDMVRAGGTDVLGLTPALNEELYRFFLGQGASVYEARLWATLLIGRMAG